MSEALKTAPGLPTADEIVACLQAALAPTDLVVLDESAAHAGHSGAGAEGYGTHFRVRIAAAAFDGLRPVAQHRLVYHALREFMDRGLHALAIETHKTA